MKAKSRESGVVDPCEELELITQKELSKRLKITVRSIQSNKSLPAIRWGRTVRYSWREVLEHLRNS